MRSSVGLDPETDMLIRISMLERIRKERDPRVANAIKREILVNEARSSTLPIILTDDTVEIRNESAQRATPVTTEIVKQFELERAERSGPNAPAWLKRFWNALEIKPGLFGIRLDVKKAMGWGEWT
ncbi:hypothetical protein IHQ71_28335 [Rhizobium sp. TH2]|uniref:hypothetical protein n=1 Tax=Rhizobium sp. TH2 TaxID=2775403 RepID=UPI0021585E33|nr:hypothetical protein [Rhizobium sp. TH2]UVC08974.1 hypothetical protein IHQ71_28335 [Rhizobium sp. TH2]